MTMLSMMIMATALSFTLLIMSLCISMSSNPNLNKPAPFECGFNPLSPPHSSFSNQFFLIAILFLAFDIEIVLILPLPLTPMSPQWALSTLSISFILILGLIYEWSFGSLQWA